MDGIGALRPAGIAAAQSAQQAQPVRPADDALLPLATTAPQSPAANGRSDNGATADRQPGQYTQTERAHLRELRTRDRAVRAHEQAHLAAAGPHARGGPGFSFETGPDGRRYAIGGEVQIDTSPASDPAATLAKARQIQRAALAPAEPSAQDRRVAAQAAAMAANAQSELSVERTATGYADESEQNPSAVLDLFA